jgi:hypothetical protein
MVAKGWVDVKLGRHMCDCHTQPFSVLVWLTKTEMVRPELRGVAQFVLHRILREQDLPKPIRVVEVKVHVLLIARSRIARVRCSCSLHPREANVQRRGNFFALIGGESPLLRREVFKRHRDV